MTESKPDEESRLREILSKKKLIQKQFRRKKSGDLDGEAENDGESPRNGGAASTGDKESKDSLKDTKQGENTNPQNDKGDNKEPATSSSERPFSGVPAMKKIISDNLEFSKKANDTKETNGRRGEKRSRRRRRRGRRHDERDYPAPISYPMDSRSYYGGGDHYDRRDIRERQPRWLPPPRYDSRRDPYGPGRPDSRGRSRSYSRSRSPSYSRSRSSSPRGDRRRYSSSRSRSRSYSSSRSRSFDSRSDKNRRRHRTRSYSRSPEPKRSKSRASSPSPESKKPPQQEEPEPVIDESTKDIRTVFVSSLVMKATESDIRRYFRKFIDGPKWAVREVILLRDRRTGRHKGGCYVELATSAHVDKALKANGVVPDFQRFPISVKRSEAEKNDFGPYVPPSAVGVGGQVQYTPDGRKIEAQKVYVGSIDRGVTQAQLYALFSGFGPLEKVLLQMDTTTGISRGFAFLSYKDPKDANLAIQTMSGQLLAGKPLKTGWANLQSAAAGVEETRSNEFPVDANEKIQKVNSILIELTGAGLVTMGGGVASAAALGILPTAELQSVAEAALDMALGGTATAIPSVLSTTGLTLPSTASNLPPAVVDATVIGRLENPSKHILVHNMFDKDEETDPGWETDIRLDFEEECQQYGMITAVVVMSKEPGGKIYASFVSGDDALKCAKNLAGRWFDKRQLRVEFVDSVPSADSIN
ncbi:hypothetical protein ACHAW6_003470 [Cyclotella cf. meneghiniana]